MAFPQTVTRARGQGKAKLVGFVLGRRFLKGSMCACEKRSDSFGQRSCVILRENRPGTPQPLHSDNALLRGISRYSRNPAK